MHKSPLLTSNFAHLQDHDAQLLRLGMLAERYFPDDPNTAILSKYRRVLDYFDAVKIGLTATPDLHTTQIFGAPIFTSSYREAVIDGFLVDREVLDDPDLVFRREGGGFARLDRIFGGELQQVLDTFNDSLWPPAA